MNVLLLGSEDRAERNGGVGVACRGLAEALVRLGIRVTVLHPGTAGSTVESGVRWRAVGGSLGVGHGGEDGLVRESGVEASHSVPGRTIPSPHPPGADRAATPSVSRGAPYFSTSHLSPYATRAGLAAPPPSAPTTQSPTSHPLHIAAERFARAAVRAATGLPIDLVHAHDWPTIPAALRLSRLRKCPLVLHIHSTEYDRSPSRPDPALIALEQRGLRLADRVVAVSQCAAETLRARYHLDAAKLTVIHNGIDPQRWIRRTGRRGPREKQPMVLFLARLTEQKDPHTFLAAAARILPARSDVRFVLAGDGPLRAALEARARELGVQAAVHFTGALEPLDVERLFALADLYVLPSAAEPFGISALEAMCLDVPVLVSRSCGVREVLPEALVFEANDADELADRILAVLSRPALHRSLATRGGRRARSLRWDYRAQRLLALFRELVP